MLKCRNQTTEVRKKTAYQCFLSALLTKYVLRPCSQRLTVSKQCESQILPLIAITMLVTASECGQTQPKTINSEWDRQAGWKTKVGVFRNFLLNIHYPNLERKYISFTLIATPNLVVT